MRHGHLQATCNQSPLCDGVKRPDRRDGGQASRAGRSHRRRELSGADTRHRRLGTGAVAPREIYVTAQDDGGRSLQRLG